MTKRFAKHFGQLAALWGAVGLGVCIAGSAAAQSQDSGGTLAVRIAEVRGSKGVVRCALFNKSSGFPDEPEKSLALDIAKISEGKAECVFRKLEPGVYAVSAYHDSDNNGELKTNFIGIPKEGWAVSNDAEPRTFGPPEFNEARFSHPGGARSISINMRY